MNRFFRLAASCTFFLLMLGLTGFAQGDSVIVRNANEAGDRPAHEMREPVRNRLFTGGNISASFGSGFTMLGASPMLGYTLNEYFDAGFVINYLFTGARDYPVYNGTNYDYADKVRQHFYGPGVFLRAYPVPFLFAQAQLEQNFFNEKFTMGGTSYKSSYNAPSLLTGAGFASGRVKGGSTFYYLSVLFDVLNNANSPYVRRNNNGTRTMQPVIRAGFNIGLGRKPKPVYQEF